MSKEKKAVELKDEELEKVAGGFSQNFCFDAGDCFEDGTIKYKVLDNYLNVLGNAKINVARYISMFSSITNTTKDASTLASYTYLGKDVF